MDNPILKILELLLEEKISVEDAVKLIEAVNKPKEIYPTFPTQPYSPIECEEDYVPFCVICSCNPKNGGSGICNCTMGNKMVPSNTSKNILKNNFTTSNYSNYD